MKPRQSFKTCLQMKLPVLFVFLFVLQIYPTSGHFFVYIKIFYSRIHKFSQLVHNVVHQIGHDPNSTILASKYPEIANLLQKKALKLEQCYNATVGGKRSSIFEVSLKNVVFNYMVNVFCLSFWFGLK